MKYKLAVVVSVLLPQIATSNPDYHSNIGKNNNLMTMNNKTVTKEIVPMEMQMKKIVKQMDKIKSLKNSDEKDELITQHIENMNSGMKSMRSMGGEFMMGVMGASNEEMAMHPMSNKTAANAATTARINKLEKRLDILQLMLDQLMVSHQIERDQRQGHMQ